MVALDFGIVADSGSMLTAPGGTYSTTGTGVGAFACSSCHDPHGRFRMQYVDAANWQWAGPVAVSGMVVGITQPIYSSGSYGNLPTANGAIGAYRLLAGVGYSPASMVTGAFPFVNNPPVAVAPASYNHAEPTKAQRGPRRLRRRHVGVVPELPHQHPPRQLRLRRHGRLGPPPPGGLGRVPEARPDQRLQHLRLVR